MLFYNRSLASFHSLCWETHSNIFLRPMQDSQLLQFSRFKPHFLVTTPSLGYEFLKACWYWLYTMIWQVIAVKVIQFITGDMIWSHSLKDAYRLETIKFNQKKWFDLVPNIPFQNHCIILLTILSRYLCAWKWEFKSPKHNRVIV